MQKFSDRNLIVIGGAPRSGTTLVQRIIGAHSQVYAGPEFDLLPQIVDLRNRFFSKIEVGRINAYLNSDNTDNIFRSFIESIFCHKVEEEGVLFISEKTPSNVLVFSELLNILPNAKFIFVVRDPRAIVASMLDVRDKFKKKKERPPHFTLNAFNAMAYINKCWQAGFLAADNNRNVIIIYYEDLINSPSDTCRMISDFMGISFEPTMVEIKDKKIDVAAEKTIENWYSKAQLSNGIVQDNLNKWSERLSSYELYVVNKSLIHRPEIAEHYSKSVGKGHNRLFDVYFFLQKTRFLLRGKIASMIKNIRKPDIL